MMDIAMLMIVVVAVWGLWGIQVGQRIGRIEIRLSERYEVARDKNGRFKKKGRSEE